MKTAMGTVLYKQSFKYLKEFSSSVNNQDCLDFDMLFLNDDLNEEELDVVLNSVKRNVVFTSGATGSTIPQLRYQLIKHAKENGYDLLVLGDFDDIFSEDRVSKFKRAFSNSFSFYYNDLYYFDSDRKFFSFLPEYTNEINQILEHNYLGMSNTALNLNNIDYKLLGKLNVERCYAFDWYMFSVLLNEGLKGKKAECCRTYYRIYENNTAGEYKNTIEHIIKEIDVKINHYSLLKKWYDNYEELYYYYSTLKLKWENEEIDLISYADTGNDFWWGHINRYN